MPTPTLLTIAGFDPSSGAGVTADLMVFAAHGGFGVSCITALTVQSTLGVFATKAVDADVVAQTLYRLADDLPIAGIKIGMLGNAENVRAVCGFLRSAPTVPVVVDPVILSTSGRELIDSAGLAALREELFPLATWATPNRNELEQLTSSKITNSTELEAAARTLSGCHPHLNLVITGGDAEAERGGRPCTDRKRHIELAAGPAHRKPRDPWDWLRIFKRTPLRAGCRFPRCANRREELRYRSNPHCKRTRRWQGANEPSLAARPGTT